MVIDVEGYRSSGIVVDRSWGDFAHHWREEPRRVGGFVVALVPRHPVGQFFQVHALLEDAQDVLLSEQLLNRFEFESFGQVADGEEVEELDKVVQIELVQVVLR